MGAVGKWFFEVAGGDLIADLHIVRQISSAMPRKEPAPHKERSSTPFYIDMFAAQAMFAAVLWLVLGVIGKFPRNSDNSMQAIYTVPTFLILAIISGILLRKRVIPHRALRIFCWCLIGFAVLAVPVALIDAIHRNGG